MVPPGEPESGELQIGSDSIVGLGFCLKPMNPPCVSGRPNHDCFFLENQYGEENPDLNPCCEGCVIREVGGMALKAGSAVYIMTSARDILLDVYLPALEEKRFSSGIFALCRYSIRPFSVPLLAVGVRARLFPYERGDCADYSTWLQADIGIKNEQTHMREEDLSTLRGLLQSAAGSALLERRSEKRDNIYFPHDPGTIR